MHTGYLIGSDCRLRRCRRRRRCCCCCCKQFNTAGSGSDSSAASPFVECFCLPGISQCVVADSRLQCGQATQLALQRHLGTHLWREGRKNRHAAGSRHRVQRACNGLPQHCTARKRHCQAKSPSQLPTSSETTKAQFASRLLGCHDLLLPYQ